MIRRKFIYIVLFIIIILSILGCVFQMQLRGFTKVGQVEKRALYEKQSDSCATLLESVYNDGITTYFLPCISSQYYLVKKGLKEYYINEALDDEIITIDDAMLYFPIFPWQPTEE